MSRRFRVEGICADVSETLELPADVCRHLRVLRAAPGDLMVLFDGAGGEFEAELTSLDHQSASVRLLRAIDNPSESELECWLVQAVPARWARMETVVRQGTELGVSRILPVVAERSQRRDLQRASAARRVERWRRIAIAAAEQSGRSRVPAIDEMVRFDQVRWDELPRPLFVGHPESAGWTEPGAAAEPAPSSAVCVMIGPEGGWTAAEIEAAMAAGAQPIDLGPRILRADTAGMVALTILQCRWGDLPWPE